MKLVYFDCGSGAAGDMIVAALLDAGADFAHLEEALATLPVGGYALDLHEVSRGGLRARRFEVTTDESRTHRRLSDILAIIDAGKLTDRAAKTARDVFRRLADAEASVHGEPASEVHFHEVGAVDAIVDICGAAICLDEIDPDRIVGSPLALGGGVALTAHGEIPIPAPAVLELTRGVPCYGGTSDWELTTPTGAAILTTVCDEFGPMPSMKPVSTGCGAGSRQIPGRANVLRAVIGETEENRPSTGFIWVLETNLDDMTPELTGYVAGRLLESGALDVFTTPVAMKKGRPGVLLTVLVEDELKAKAEELLFAETTTFGIRCHRVERATLHRRTVMVETAFGEVGVKVGSAGGRVLSVSPEFEDCANAARAAGVPLKRVYAAARCAASAGGLSADAGKDHTD